MENKPILKKVKAVRRVSADLYGPEKNEEDSLVGLMRKLAARRDYWKQKHGGKETVLNWSFCLGPTSKILTNYGYYDASNIEFLSRQDVKLWSGHSWVSKKDWINSGICESFKVIFMDGTSTIMSWNHPVIEKHGVKQAFQLKVGDILKPNTLSIPQEDNKLYQLYGLLRDLDFDSEYSDGSLKVFFIEEFKDGISYITDLLDDLNIGWHISTIYGVDRVFINREDTFKLKDFVFRQKRNDREINISILNHPEFYASYLKGAFDADGSVVKQQLRLTQTSYRLAQQSVLMLEALGFTCSIQGSNDSGRINTKFDVNIKGGVIAFQRFLDIIGFSIKRKENSLKEYIFKASRINNFFIGKKIKHIESCRENVYGPVEVKGNWYIADGIYNHNTPFTSKNQCIGPDEFVVTNKGMLKASDKRLFDTNTLVWNGSSFVGKKNWTESEEVPSLRLNFIDGDSAIVSANHPVRINNRLVIAFALKEGDTIDFSYNKVPQADFSEKAYLVGLLRDSSIQTSDGKVNKVYFTEEFVDGTNYITSTLDALGIRWTKTMIEGAERITIGFDSEISKIDDLLFKNKRHEREVQKFVLENTKYFASYISGVFDADGSITKSRGTYHVRIDQTSKNLAIQTMRILQFLGIDCSIACSSRIGHDKYTIRIKGGFKGRKALVDTLNLKIERKKQLLKESIASAPRTGRPLEGKTIKSIERIYSKVYGPNELVGEWYVSNGFYSHNTPFEFASCMGGLTNKKTLQPAVEEARKLGFKFRVGTSSDTSTIAQVLTLGDRRLNNVIYRAYKEGIIQYFGGMSCFPKGTLVTTQTTFKDISEIKIGDTLADGSTVMRTMSRKVDELIGIKAASLPTVWMTKNHPVLTSTGDFVEASNLKVGQELLVPIRKRTIKPLKEITLLRRKNQYLPYFEVNLPLDKEFVQFIALYLADGYTSKNRVVIVSGSKHAKYGFDKMLENISAWFESKGISVRKHKGSSSNTYIKTKHPVFTYQFNSSSLQEWVDNNLGKGAKSKILPDFMFGLSNDLIEDFFEAYSDCSITKGVRIYSTSNKSMALSLEELGLKINKYFSISERKNGLSDNICYYLGELKQLQTISFSENFVKCKITKLLSKKGDFEVFNLTTSNHVYDVPFRVHNCGKDPLEPFEALLKEEIGHTYETYGEEKMLNQVFPWDFINLGMTKEHLKERYLLAKAAQNSPFGCFIHCAHCGACMVSQNDLPQVSFVDATKQFQII